MNPDKAYDKACYYRGVIISEFAMFEKTIDFKLATHFAKTKKKQYEMIQIIFDRMTFESKRTALKHLYDKKSEADGFVKTKNNSYPHNKLFNEIRRLNDHRNYFAHYMLTHNRKALKDVVVILVEVRDNVDAKTYTLNQINDLVDTMHKISNEILEEEL